MGLSILRNTRLTVYRLGEVPALALVLNFFLQDSAKEGIWSGPLIETLLKASCTLNVHYALLTNV